MIYRVGYFHKDQGRYVGLRPCRMIRRNIFGPLLNLGGCFRMSTYPENLRYLNGVLGLIFILIEPFRRKQPCGGSPSSLQFSSVGGFAELWDITQRLSLYQRKTIFERFVNVEERSGWYRLYWLFYYGHRMWQAWSQASDSHNELTMKR